MAATEFTHGTSAEQKEKASPWFYSLCHDLLCSLYNLYLFENFPEKNKWFCSD
jgi:hypothetical protein